MDIEHPRYDSNLNESTKDVPKRTNINNVNSKKTASKNTPVVNKANPTKNNNGSNDNFWPIYLIGIIIVAILAFFGVRAASSLFDVWTDLDPSKLDEAENVESVEPAETEDEAAAANESSPALELVEKEAEETKVVIDKSSLKIKVLNGSGVSGAAQAGKDLLEEKGYSVDSTGNAKTFNYDSTMVYYVGGKEKEAQLVADSISDKYESSIEENSVAEGYDVLVVIGKK